MKIAVIGAGSIGGLVGARLAFAGDDVTLLLRGTNFAAIRQNGLALVEANGQRRSTKALRCTSDYAEDDGRAARSRPAAGGHRLNLRLALSVPP